MAAAKRTKGQTEVAWSEVSALVAAGARRHDASAARARSATRPCSTSLDAVAAQDDSGSTTPRRCSRPRRSAIDETARRLQAASRPSSAGRACSPRKSMTLDDPGMVAFQRVVERAGVGLVSQEVYGSHSASLVSYLRVGLEARVPAAPVDRRNLLSISRMSNLPPRDDEAQTAAEAPDRVDDSAHGL